MAEACGGVRAALTEAAARLALVSDTPRLDAELLLAHALGVAREALLLDPARFAVPAAFAALVERRLAHEPVAYILGQRDFWSISLTVGPGALVPRADSETLIAAAVQRFGMAGPARILDLGTGPGTLLLAALDEWPDASGVGLERSAAALAYARANADALGLAARCDWVAGDWHDAALLGGLGQFDLILANPPYIERDAVLDRQVAQHEPPEALFAGADGLDDYRVLIPALPALLARAGLALVEIGWTQATAVTALAAAAGFDVAIHPDLGGRDRALALTRR